MHLIISLLFVIWMMLMAVIAGQMIVVTNRSKWMKEIEFRISVLENK